MKRGWVWLHVADVAAAMRWPFDHCARGKYGAQNDNAWVRFKGTWVHFLDLPATKAYWRGMGWA